MTQTSEDHFFEVERTDNLVSTFPSFFFPSNHRATNRYITILSSEDNGGTAGSIDDDDKLDLRTLRAIRVLRPLKLVSGVPSKSGRYFNFRCFLAKTSSISVSFSSVSFLL